MKINLKIMGEHLSSGDNIHAYVHEKLRSALKHTSQYIDQVIVRLTDLNGPKGGMDKMCSIQLSIPGQSPVLVKSHDSNLYTAVSEAISRAAQKSQRRIRRRQFVSLGGKLRNTRETTGYRANPLFASYENI